MNAINFCANCGNKLATKNVFCPKCGTKIEAAPIPYQNPKSPPPSIALQKSGKTALILCMLFGMLGVHRFYVGKITTGILMLCSGGLLGVWVIIDLITISRNKFEDKDGDALELIHNITPIKETILVAGSIMLWVALFFAGLALFFGQSTSGLATVIESQLTALKQGQMDKAYAYTAQSYQKNNSVDTFKNFVYAHPILINHVSFNFPERKIMNTNGFARGVLTAKDGIKTPVMYQLIQENGAWRVVNINIAVLPP